MGEQQAVNVTLFRFIRIAFIIFAAVLSAVALTTLFYDIATGKSLAASIKPFWTNPSNIVALVVDCAFAVSSVIIARDAWLRFAKNHKPSPLLLSLMFLFLVFTAAIQVVNLSMNLPGGSFFCGKSRANRTTAARPRKSLCYERTLV